MAPVSQVSRKGRKVDERYFLELHPAKKEVILLKRQVSRPKPHILYILLHSTTNLNYCYISVYCGV